MRIIIMFRTRVRSGFAILFDYFALVLRKKNETIQRARILRQLVSETGKPYRDNNSYTDRIRRNGKKQYLLIRKGIRAQNTFFHRASAKFGVIVFN